MFRVLSCLGGEHDPRLVALAAVVCLAGSIVTINLFQRTRGVTGHGRFGWVLGAGTAGGCSIWATHFIAMLAYRPGVPVAFEIAYTILSLACAVVMTCIGIGIAVIGEERWSRILGGITIGLAIASMHFLGMRALEVPADITWSIRLVAASITFGILLSTVALDLAARGNATATTVAASLALSAAIVLLHFTAMGAAILVPDPARLVTPLSIAPSSLAVYVAAAAAAILAIGIVGLIVDRRMSEKSLQLEVALHNMSQGLCMLNGNAEVIVVNGRFLEMFAIAADLVSPRMPMAQLMDLAERAAPFGIDGRKAIKAWAHDLGREKKSGKMLVQRSDGRVFSISHEHMPGVDGWVETFEDVTERRQAEEKIAYMARHDGLTDLANRILFREELESALRDIDRSKGFAVLCLDLDHFKFVNDTLGHHSGDQVLKVAAERLCQAVRESDLVARCGGDEFAILQLESNQPAAATALARRLVDVMNAPMMVGDHQVPIGASIGISLAPTDGTDPDQLLNNADMALYRAKGDGRGTYRFFESEMDARMQARRLLELDLRQAVTVNAFELHYQPIIDLTTDEVASFEALIRWRHPERGLVAPADFIPLAEETGLIVPIGEWVLLRACEDAAKWPEHVHVAVNLSPAQFKTAGLSAVVVRALAASGLTPQRLELEITESVLLQDAESTLATLHGLRDLGVRISMDDFGTGYSSLSYLRKFPFDKIKIDQSFIRDLADGGDSLAIVRAVTGLGSSLGITTVAEGVETPEQLKRLKAEGCTRAQGFLFGAAEPADEAVRHLIANRKLRIVA